MSLTISSTFYHHGFLGPGQTVKITYREKQFLTPASVALTARLLPMNGKNMIEDVFSSLYISIEPQLLNQSWETTRFCLSPDVTTNSNLIANAIMIGGLAHGLNLGFHHYLGVFDRLMKRAYKRTTWEPQIVASGNDPISGKIYLGKWHIHKNQIATMIHRFHDVGTYRVINHLEPGSACLVSQLIKPFYRRNMYEKALD